MRELGVLLPKEYGWTSADCLNAGYVELAKRKSFEVIEHTADGVELFTYLKVSILEQNPGRSIFWFSWQTESQMEEWIRHLGLEKMMESGLGGIESFQRLADPQMKNSGERKNEPCKKNELFGLGSWASQVDFHTREGYLAFELMMIYVLLHRNEEKLLQAWLTLFTLHTEQKYVDLYLLVHLELAVRLGKKEEANDLFQQLESRFSASDGLITPDMLFCASLQSFVRIEIIGFMCFGSQIRTNIRRFIGLANQKEEAGVRIDWSKVFQAPMLLEEAIRLYGEEALLIRLPEMANWIEWMADWQVGDYQSVIELMDEMEGQASNNAQSKSISVIKERLFYVRGGEGDVPPDFGFDQNGLNRIGSDLQQGTEIELLKYYLGSERNIRTAPWYGSQLAGGMSTAKGSTCFENYLDGEYGWIQEDEMRGRRACHRVEQSDWYFPWFLGRIYDFEGEWGQSIEAYLQLKKNLKDVYPGHFLHGEVEGRLAWAYFSLGQIDEGLLALDQMANYIENYAIENQMLLYKYDRLLAKAHFLTGWYENALTLYQKLIGKRRWGNRLDREGGWLLYELVSVWLEMGHLTKAKEEIDRSVGEFSEWELYKSILELKWAALAGEKQLYLQGKKTLMGKGMLEKPGQNRFLKTWEQEELLAFVIETDLRLGILNKDDLELIRDQHLKESARSIYHFGLWLSWINAQIVLGNEVEDDLWLARSQDVVLFSNSLPLQVKWLQVEAKRVEKPVDLLKSAYELLVKFKGKGSMDAIEAKVAWLEAEENQEVFLVELPFICKQVMHAVKERLGVLPSERQLLAMKQLVGMYEKILLRALKNLQGIDLNHLLRLTYALKNINMRIHQITALLLREEKQTDLLEKFALLSQQIVEVPVLSDSDQKRHEQWVRERDRLAVSMNKYRESAIDEVQEFVVPDLPLGKCYVELVATDNYVFRWLKTDEGWRLENLGTMVLWEKRLRQFRKKLMRGQGVFATLSKELFAGINRNRPVRLAPDGLFFSLPWFELARDAAVFDFEVWPNLSFFAEGREVYRVYKGNAVFVPEFEGKSSLPWVKQEEFSCWLDGMEVMDGEIDETPLLDLPDILHFSGHGQILKPMAEGILRNPFVEAQLCMPKNKVVTALDLALRDWSWTRFVYVNACETSAGEYVPMEGVLGISYALFLGGAHSILVTLYPVQDEVAAQFSLSFYGNLQKTRSRRDAFVLTKAELADRYSQKALAAFQLMGTGDELLETVFSRLVRFGRRWARKHKK
ncbi:hypothetical protein SANA_28370 [Gottschalkiaceae bacterium SANA]|nr:hypothetical protein SANA_28370 [Gottschalkiaceae bacterium SANA]